MTKPSLLRPNQLVMSDFYKIETESKDSQPRTLSDVVSILRKSYEHHRLSVAITPSSGLAISALMNEISGGHGSKDDLVTVVDTHSEGLTSELIRKTLGSEYWTKNPIYRNWKHPEHQDLMKRDSFDMIFLGADSKHDIDFMQSLGKRASLILIDSSGNCFSEFESVADWREDQPIFEVTSIDDALANCTPAFN